MGALIRQKTAVVTCFIFMSLLISNAFALESSQTVEARTLIERGEQFLRDGEFQDALECFNKAIPVTQDNHLLAKIYFNISRVYYSINNINKTEENLRKMFELDLEIKIDESQFDAEYSMIYKKVNAEYWFSLSSFDRTEKQRDKRIIQQLSKRPEKKKSKLLPILIIGGIVIVSMVMAILFWKSSDEDNRGMLKVINQSDDHISVIIGTLNRLVAANSSTLIYLEEGTHEVEILGQSKSAFYTITIVANVMSILNWYGWEVL